MASLGSEVRSIVMVVQARLNGHPDSADEWRTIHRQLRTASDKARRITRLAERMESPIVFPDTTPVQDVQQAIEAFDNGGNR